MAILNQIAVVGIRTLAGWISDYKEYVVSFSGDEHGKQQRGEIRKSNLKVDLIQTLLTIYKAIKYNEKRYILLIEW